MIKETKYFGYFVNSKGEVLSNWRGKKTIRKPQPGRNKRYLRTSVSFNTKRKYVTIHRLVCETWHGPKPFPGAVVRHLDDNPFNNRPKNLAWGSNKDNSLDRVRNGTMQYGQMLKASKLTNRRVRRIRKLYASGKSSFTQLAKAYKVTHRTVALIVKRETWKHI